MKWEDEHERWIYKNLKEVVAYFKVQSQHSQGREQKTMKTSATIAGNQAEIWTRYSPNIR